jgi:AmmeMemoRadiSam system protein A
MAATDAPTPLRRPHRERLLRIARNAIAAKLGSTGVGADVGELPAELTEPSGAFVSLHVDGRLRGCIGSIHASDPLAETVAEMAVAAATSDPRFPAMSARELRDTDIEVSVLTPLRPIAPEDVEVGTHGLYVIQGRYRGLLLPQVPTQYGWDRETFLAQVCHKAGLPSDAWRAKDTQLLAFTAEVFSEESLSDELDPRDL